MVWDGWEVCGYKEENVWPGVGCDKELSDGIDVHVSAAPHLSSFPISSLHSPFMLDISNMDAEFVARTGPICLALWYKKTFLGPTAEHLP